MHIEAATGMVRGNALLAETGISGAAWNPGKVEKYIQALDGRDPRYPFGDDGLVCITARWIIAIEHPHVQNLIRITGCHHRTIAQNTPSQRPAQ